MRRWGLLRLFAPVFLFGLLLFGGAHAQGFLDANSGKTVFIQAFPDANMLPTEARAAGTGVLLKGGYVLTARHFAEHGPIKGAGAMVFQGRIGDAEASPLKLAYIDENVDHDLLLLRFNQTAVQGGGFACLRSPESPIAAGEPIIILGFPQAANVTAGGSQPEHHLDIRSGAISAVSAAQMFSDINITYGHSGAPVFDSDARVVGIARGELTVGDQGTDTAVLVPIERAEPMMPAIVKQASQEECGDAPPTPPTGIRGQEEVSSDDAVALNARGQALLGFDVMELSAGATVGTKSSNINLALQDFDRAIALRPSLSEASFNRGIVYLRKAILSNASDKPQSLERAIQDFDRALSLRPNYFEALLARGRAYYLRGNDASDYDKATKDFEMARILNPDTASKVIGSDDVRAVLGKAKFLLAEQDFDSAISELSSIGRTGIEGGTLPVLFAMAHAGKRDCDGAAMVRHHFFLYKDDAANDEEYLTELQKELEYHTILGNCYLSQHRYDDAVDFYDTAIEIAGLGSGREVYLRSAEERVRDAEIGKKIPSDIKGNLFYRRGIAFRAKQEYGKAITDFERALQLDPGNVGVRTALAETKEL